MARSRLIALPSASLPKRHSGQCGLRFASAPRAVNAVLAVFRDFTVTCSGRAPATFANVRNKDTDNDKGGEKNCVAPAAVITHYDDDNEVSVSQDDTDAVATIEMTTITITISIVFMHGYPMWWWWWWMWWMWWWWMWWMWWWWWVVASVAGG